MVGRETLIDKYTETELDTGTGTGTEPASAKDRKRGKYSGKERQKTHRDRVKDAKPF